jgi:DNA (cytosine-5)-methyltransferase 1
LLCLKTFIEHQHLTHLDLCSGIGGFTLAAEVEEYTTLAVCEKKPWAQNLLSKRFPHIPLEPDMFTLDIQKYYGIFLITAGIPCQPYSLIGERMAWSDVRYLWTRTRDIIQGTNTSWVVLENVDGITDMDLDFITLDLAKAGYTSERFRVPARAVGADHERYRVILVAHSMRSRTQRLVAPDSISLSRQRGRCSEAPLQVTDARISPLFGRPNGTTPLLCRGTDGVPDRVDRLDGLGEAIVPQVFIPFLRYIKKVSLYQEL